MSPEELLKEQICACGSLCFAGGGLDGDVISRAFDMLQAIVNGCDRNGWLTGFSSARILCRCLQKGRGTFRDHFSSRS